MTRGNENVLLDNRVSWTSRWPQKAFLVAQEFKTLKRFEIFFQVHHDTIENGSSRLRCYGKYMEESRSWTVSSMRRPPRFFKSSRVHSTQFHVPGWKFRLPLHWDLRPLRIAKIIELSLKDFLIANLASVAQLNQHE